MIDPKVALILLAVTLTVYGAKAGIGAVGHLFKKTAQVVSQPVRHPVKDAKAVAHKVAGN
jgi:hypothetical protein